MDTLNPIACENCRLKKCKCDRTIPACSQCLNLSIPCRYQEGGKRGLPAAYITNLEKRLQETEAALSATLLALQNHIGSDLTGIDLAPLYPVPSGRELSKVEKQDEWRRLPMGNSRQLLTWLRAKHPNSVPSGSGQPASLRLDADPHFSGVPNVENLGDNTTPSIISGTSEQHLPPPSESTQKSTKEILEQLQICIPPPVPNTSAYLSKQLPPEKVTFLDNTVEKISATCSRNGTYIPETVGVLLWADQRAESDLIRKVMENEEDRFSPSDSRVEDERPSKRRRTMAAPTREVGLMRTIPGDKSSGFVGSASGIYFIRSVYGAFRPFRPSSPAHIETPGSDIVPGEDDHLPTMVPNSSDRLWNNDEVTSVPPSSISFQDLVNWTGSYFANWHPAYPFLHAPTVLEYFDSLSHNDRNRDYPPEDFQMIVLRSIMSISLADRRQSSSTDHAHFPIELVFPSYNAAVESLRHVLLRPTSISALQAAISVQLFLVSMLRLNAASRLGGLIIRMALQLGLHRCPSRYQSFSPSVRELRQRIFWSVYTLDRFVCQSMGLPLGLHDDDLDVCYPITELHLEEHVPRPDNSRLRVLDLLARHAKMRGEIMELRNKSVHYVQKDPDRATAITAKLAQWWNEIEEFNDIDNESGPSAYYLTILSLLKHESIISLNRPTLAASHQGPSYDAALQLCIGSARSIITALYKCLKSKHGTGQDFESLTLLWPSCTWAVWISTFILFYAAHRKHVSQNIVARSADRSLEILQHLSRRGSVWPEASAAAIRDLRTKMVNREPVTLSSDQIGPDGNELIHINRGHEPALDLSESSQYGIPISANATTNRPAPGNGTVTPTTSMGLPFRPENNPSSSMNVGVQSSLDQDIVFDLGNDDWNDFMNANGPIGPNTMLGEQNVDPFSGFDIPFWFEQEQHWDVLQ